MGFIRLKISKKLSKILFKIKYSYIISFVYYYHINLIKLFQRLKDMSIQEVIFNLIMQDASLIKSFLYALTSGRNKFDILSKEFMQAV